MTKAEIQFVRSLADKRARDTHGMFIAEGSKLVEEIQHSSWRIESVYTTRKELTGGNVTHIERKEMERISQLKTANDTLAVVHIPHYSLSMEELDNGLTLALDGVQNPGNMGTIIRLADWFGVKNIVCSAECADCYSPKVIQATMGAILRVKVHYVDDLAQLLQSAARRKVAIYGTLLDGDNIYAAELQDSGIIVMGNEGRGVSEECQQTITHSLFIPPYPTNAATSESLNVAMATGIVLAEFRRPR